MTSPHLRPDIDAALQARHDTGPGEAEVAVLRQHVGADERVLCLARAVSGRTHGLLVLTDRRYLFLHEGRNRSSQTSVALDLVSAVHVRHGLLSAQIRTQGPQSLAEFKQVDKVDAELFARALRGLVDGRPRVPEQATALRSTGTRAGGDGTVLLLRQLDEQLSRGVLTPAEYESRKRELLRRR